MYDYTCRLNHTKKSSYYVLLLETRLIPCNVRSLQKFAPCSAVLNRAVARRYVPVLWRRQPFGFASSFCQRMRRGPSCQMMFQLAERERETYSWGLLRREHRRTQMGELGKKMIQRVLHNWKMVPRDSHHHHQRRRWSVGTVQPGWPGGLLQDRLLQHASDMMGLRIGLMGLRTETMDIHHRRRHHLRERRHWLLPAEEADGSSPGAGVRRTGLRS